MVLEKWQKIREGKTYEPSNVAKSWAFSQLLQLITGKSKNWIASDFSRKKIKLSTIEDVKNYIEERYKKKYL